MPATEGGGIFVSYRRQESSHLAGRLYDRLADRFGEGQVFIDVDTIEPGVDFTEEILRAVAACRVLVAVIGPNWLIATDQRGRRRLEDPDDIVRLEIEAALARGVRVFPILVEGAVMPGREDLPESLAGLARRNALLIRHESFRYDAGRLVAAIERMLAAPGTAAVANASAAHRVKSAGNAVGEVAQTGPGPARNDLGRPVQLLVDAEAIARSITDETWKASALSGIAEALAAIDPDRAAQLLADTERIALAITDESSKASALSDVAKVLAATDPDRAEHIARSITDEPSKAWALSAVMKTLAATDPDRAENMADSITDESAKAWALSGIAEALAATDPGHVENIAQSITNEFLKVLALSSVSEALAATDPDRAARLLAHAERIAQSLTDESSKAWALSNVAKVLAANDPDRAEGIARSITDEFWKAWALCGVAKALAAASS